MYLSSNILPGNILESDLGFRFPREISWPFHPVTLDDDTAGIFQLNQLFSALERLVIRVLFSRFQMQMQAVVLSTHIKHFWIVILQLPGTPHSGSCVISPVYVT